MLFRSKIIGICFSDREREKKDRDCSVSINVPYHLFEAPEALSAAAAVQAAVVVVVGGHVDLELELTI